MREPRYITNKKSRQEQSDRRYEYMDAVLECRSAAAEKEGATYDPFSRISDQSYDPISSVLHNLGVTNDEYAAWKAAYEADTPHREARRQAKEESEILQDISACQEWLAEEDEAPEAFRRLNAKAQVFEDGLEAFLEKYGISEEDWWELRRLSASVR